MRFYFALMIMRALMLRKKKTLTGCEEGGNGLRSNRDCFCVLINVL